ncbi:MAG: hypothetical protein ITG02_14275 [Patulibacter sp.]|nr:hypothetical protein [Patulibacter sp.]
MESRTAVPLFRIVQVEIAGEIDLPSGRWTVRGHANRPRAVVVVEATERPPRRFRRKRRKLAAATAVPAARVTVVDADPIVTDDPDRWLAEHDADEAVDQALATIDRLSHVNAIAADEPRPRPVRWRDLTRALLAYGTGYEGADGSWSTHRAVSVAADQPRRVRRSGRGLGNEERLADLLSGRDPVLAAEPLSLRVQHDLEAEHFREAALQLRIAVEVAIAELEPWRDALHVDSALDELRGARGAVAETATAAVRGGLSDEQVETVRAVATTLQNALLRRSRGRRIGERTSPAR